MSGSKNNWNKMSVSKPVYSDVAKKLMAGMGYTGGGLGKSGQGIHEPIDPTRRTRLGIGYVSPDTLPEQAKDNDPPDTAPEQAEDNDPLQLPRNPQISGHRFSAEAKRSKAWEYSMAQAAKAWEDLLSTVPGRDFRKKDEQKQPDEEKEEKTVGKSESFCIPPRDGMEFPASTFSHEFLHDENAIELTGGKNKRRRRRRNGEREKVELVFAARFSPDGEHLASCCSSTIKVWDWIMKKNKTVMSLIGDDGFRCIEFSPDSQKLAAGSNDGKIKVFDLKSGTLVHTQEGASSKAITSLSFSHDGNLLLCSSTMDQMSRIMELTSSQYIKEFSGDRAIFSKEGSHIVTARSDDCTINVYDLITCKCLKTIDTRPSMRGRKALVNSVHIFPKASDQLLVCNKTSTICIITLKGELVKSFKCNDQGSAFLAACVSPKGDFIYAIGEDSMVYCFRYGSGRLEERFQVKGVCGLTIHPQRNLLATYCKDTTMRLFGCRID